MKFLIVLFAAAAFACGGTDASLSTSVSGTVGGVSLGSVVDTQALVLNNGSCDGSSPTSNFVAVELASTAGICSGVSANRSTPNATTLALLVTTFWVAPAGTTTPPANAPALQLNTAYPINNNLNTAPKDSNGFGVAATATFQSTDAACNSKLSSGGENATGGSVTLTSISSSGVSGTFSLTFATGTLTGSFSSGNCGLNTSQVCAVFSNQTDPTCG
jgi:hypothetical protein